MISRRIKAAIVMLVVLAAAVPARADLQRITLTDTLGGLVTSVVPLGDGMVLAANGERLLRFDVSGAEPRIAADIAPDYGAILQLAHTADLVFALTEVGVLVLDGGSGHPISYVPGTGQALAARMDTIAVAMREGGVRLLTISANGQVLTDHVVSLPGDALDVTLGQEYAYVALGEAGIAEINLSEETVNTDFPRINPVSRLTLTETGLLAAASAGRVTLIDPEAGSIIGAYAPMRAARRIAMDEDYAFIADEIDGLKIMWMAAPERPLLVYGETGQPAYDLALSDQVAVVVGERALRIIDVSSRFRPLTFGTVDLPAAGRAVALDGAAVYVALGEEGIAIIDAANRAAPRLTGRIPVEGPAHDVLTANGWLYTALGEAGIAAYRLRADGPEFAQLLPLGCPAQSLDRRGNALFVACGETGLAAVDIIRPFEMALAGTLAPEAGGAFTELTIDGKRAYVAGSQGMTVIDVSRPDRMGRLTRVPAEGVQAASINGVYVYAVGDERLHTFDARATAEPLLLRTYQSILQIADIAAAGDQLYLSNLSDGTDLITVSLATPAAPFEVANQGEVGHTAHMSAGQGSLWLARGLGGFQHFSITSGSAPRPVQEYATLPDITHVAGLGSSVLAAGGGGWTRASVVEPGGLQPGDVGVGLPPIRSSAVDEEGAAFAWVAGGVGYLQGGALVEQPAINAVEVALSTDYVFAIDGSGLHILDRRFLIPLSQIPLPAPPVSMAQYGAEIVLSLADGTLARIDPGDPTRGMIPLTQIETRRPARFIEGPEGVATISENGVLRLDTSNPAQLRVLERGPLLDPASEGLFIDDLLAAYLPGQPVVLYDIRGLGEGVTRVGSFEADGQDVVVRSSFAYIASSEDGLLLTDIRSSETRRTLAETPTVDLLAAGEVLFALGETLTAWDIQIPESPRRLAEFEVSGSHLAWRADGLLLVSQAESLQMIRFDGESFSQEGVLPVDAVRTALTSQWGFAAARGGGLHVLALHEEAQPELLFTLSSTLGRFVHDLLVLDDDHLLISWDGGLEVITIGNMAGAPHLVDSASVGASGDLHLIEDRAAIAHGEGRVSVFDVATWPPTPLMEVNTPGQALAAALHEGILFVADGSCGLRAFEGGVETGYWRGRYLSDLHIIPSGQIVAVDGGQLVALRYEPGLPVTPPPIPQQPDPPNGASGLPGAVPLSWGPPPDPCDPLQYTVYLGVDDDPPFVGRVNGETILPIIDLNPAVAYFWRVEAVDRQGDVSTSPVWRFSIAPAEFNPGPPAPQTFLQRLRRSPTVPILLLTVVVASVVAAYWAARSSRT